MIETIHRVEILGTDGRWQFYATAEKMTAKQAVELATHRNAKSRGDLFRAVRVTETREVEVLE